MVLSINKGFTLVEAMLAVAMLLIMSVGSVAANRLSTTGVTINQQRSRANNLAVEAMEALMSVRADNFLVISPGTFHPSFNGTKWVLLPGSEVIDGFTRSIKIDFVMRELVCFDAVCDIIPEGGINDEGTFKAEVVVSWNQGNENKSVKLNSLITYWR